MPVLNMPENHSPVCRHACHVQTDRMAAVLLAADEAGPYHRNIASGHFNEGQTAGIPSPPRDRCPQNMWNRGMRMCRDPQADVAAFQAEGGNILVGTPGRLADVFERSKVLDPKHLEVLVLDEADRLLDAGYGRHLENLMRRLPKQRRTGTNLAWVPHVVSLSSLVLLRQSFRSLDMKLCKSNPLQVGWPEV